MAVGAVLAGGLLLGGCQPKKPLLDLQDVKLRSIGTSKLDMVLEFRVFNTNLWDARLKHLEFAVNLAGKDVMVGRLAQPPGPFKALQWQSVEVPASILLRNLPEITTRAREARELDGNVHCQALFEVLGIDIHSNLYKPIQITKPRWPIWRYKTVRLDAKDESFEVVFDAENPNSFDLPTTGIKGKLLLGDLPLAEINVPYPGSIPAHGKVEVVLHVEMKFPKIEKSSWRTWIRREPIRFEGNFDLDPPISLRQASGARGDKP